MALSTLIEASEETDKDGTPRRRESKAFRRQQLINATIDTLAKKGFAATTLVDVANRANLSRGIVNFHFESKEKLLLATIEFIAEAYGENWRAELEKVKDGSSAEKMHALVHADLNRKVCTPRLVSAWFGFYAEAQSRPMFRDLCWTRDKEYLSALRNLCVALKKEGGYRFDPDRAADAIYAVQEGLWLRLMMGSKSLNRTLALSIALATLGTMFAEHFDVEGNPINEGKSSGKNPSRG